MGAWSSSDGGSITSIGNEEFAGTINGGVDLVTAAANVKGIILRTALIFNASAVAGGVFFNRIGTDIYLAYLDGQGVTDIGREIFIPPGVQLRAFSNSGDSYGYFSWDVLT